MSECQTMCNNTDFCAYCKDDKHCQEFNSVSVSNCNTENVCILPNGSYVLGLDEGKTYIGNTPDCV